MARLDRNDVGHAVIPNAVHRVCVRARGLPESSVMAVGRCSSEWARRDGITASRGRRPCSACMLVCGASTDSVRPPL